MVERVVDEIGQKRIRRGVFKSVDELEQTIMDYLKNHNADPKPYVWTKSATEILQKVARAKQALESLHYQADDTPYLNRICTGWIAPTSWRTSRIDHSVHRYSVYAPIVQREFLDQPMARNSRNLTAVPVAILTKKHAPTARSMPTRERNGREDSGGGLGAAGKPIGAGVSQLGQNSR